MTRLSPTFLAISSSLLIAPGWSFEVYATQIPNGSKVANVKAVGHRKLKGGNFRNAFGNSFASAGHKWTTALCETDSDGDGQTNGEELGDPCCEWSVHSFRSPRWSSGLSNPGDSSSKSDKSSWPAYHCFH